MEEKEEFKEAMRIYLKTGWDNRLYDLYTKILEEEKEENVMSTINMY